MENIVPVMADLRNDNEWKAAAPNGSVGPIRSCVRQNAAANSNR
jgi:hypothetical protein